MDKKRIKLICVVAILALCVLKGARLFWFMDYLGAKKISMFDDGKGIVDLYIPNVQFVDKKYNKINDVKQEISEIKKYILGIGDKDPRDIVEIQFGIKRYLNIEEKIERVDEDDKSKDDCLTSGEIKITNETNYKIDIDELLKEPLSKKVIDDSKVLIYHTHTNESYIRNIKEINDMSVLPRSHDENINVLKVGDELCKNLSKLNISTIHNKRYHNVPKDKGAYARSLDTVCEYLKKEPSIEIVLDIHRDGISNSKKLREVCNIDNKDVAKIMFVVGTDARGLSHSNWRENLKFAVKLQEKLISYNPDIVKPIFISKNRYNQHLTNFSLIIEVGGDGNVITESMESTKYIARALNDLLKEN